MRGLLGLGLQGRSYRPTQTKPNFLWAYTEVV
jgi:hypothetical protein